jgi:hypothetical protein
MRDDGARLGREDVGSRLADAEFAEDEWRSEGADENITI